MQINADLKQKLSKAVQTSMRIEGYQPTLSQSIKQQAKALMDQHRVQVSIPSK
jgi:hypothetical protein